MADMNLAIALSMVDEASPGFVKAANGLGALEASAGKAGTAMGGLGGSLGDLGKMALSFAAGGVIFGALSNIPATLASVVTSTTDLGQATFKLQAIIGGTDESASSLLAVFERYGVNVDQATVSLGIFSRHLAGIEDLTSGIIPGSKSFTQSMHDLGVEFTDASGKALPMNQVLLSVADKFATLGPGADRTAIAMQLFGRSGRDMIPVLALGAAGMQEAEDAAKKYGLTLSGENVASIRAYGLAHKDLDEAMQGVSLTVGNMLMPALTTLATGVATDAQEINQNLIPAIKSTGDEAGRLGGILGLLGQDAVKLEAILGSNASASTAMTSAADETVASMGSFAEKALAVTLAVTGAAGAIGLTVIEVEALGKVVGYTAPPLQTIISSTMALHDATDNLGSAAKATRDPIQHLGDTMAAVSGNADELTQSYINQHSAAMNLTDATNKLIAANAAAASRDPNAGHPVWSTDPSSQAAFKAEGHHILQDNLSADEKAADKAARALAGVGTSALASLPGLSALDMQIAGTSQDLAKVQLQIEDKAWERIKNRPINTLYQQEAYDQEKLRHEQLQKAAGYTVGTEGLKVDKAKHLAPGTTAGGVTVHVDAVHINAADADKAGTDFATFLKGLTKGGSGGKASTSLSGIKN